MTCTPEDVHGASRPRRIARSLGHWVGHVRGIGRVLHLQLEHTRVELRRLRGGVTKGAAPKTNCATAAIRVEVSVRVTTRAAGQPFQQ